MKREVERARARVDQTRDLADQARDARDTLNQYEERTGDDGTPRSHARLRDLEQARDLAETRLRMAQTDPSAPTKPEGDDPPQQDTDDERGDEGGAPAWPL